MLTSNWRRAASRSWMAWTSTSSCWCTVNWSRRLKHTEITGTFSVKLPHYAQQRGTKKHLKQSKEQYVFSKASVQWMPISPWVYFESHDTLHLQGTLYWSVIVLWKAYLAHWQHKKHIAMSTACNPVHSTNTPPVEWPAYTHMPHSPSLKKGQNKTKPGQHPVEGTYPSPSRRSSSSPSIDWSTQSTNKEQRRKSMNRWASAIKREQFNFHHRQTRGKVGIYMYRYEALFKALLLFLKSMGLSNCHDQEQKGSNRSTQHMNRQNPECPEAKQNKCNLSSPTCLFLKRYAKVHETNDLVLSTTRQITPG